MKVNLVSVKANNFLIKRVYAKAQLSRPVKFLIQINEVYYEKGHFREPGSENWMT